MADPARPGWVPSDLYPFEDHYLEVGGARVHYVDEGDGPVVLMLHGNPTWSFLYREVIAGLRGRMRCIALDYPGFGLSTAPAEYGFLPAEHADVVDQFVLALDLQEVTLMVQDWGGPIGFAVATRHPGRFSRFVIGNTWAWPKENLSARAFSAVLGGALGRRLIARHNLFVERILPAGVRSRSLSDAEMGAYRGPFPTPGSRRPTAVLPREIIHSKAFLAGVRDALPSVAHLPALILWPTRDVAFRRRERRHWERTFPHARTVLLRGAGHYMQEDAATRIVTEMLESAAGSLR